MPVEDAKVNLDAEEVATSLETDLKIARQTSSDESLVQPHAQQEEVIIDKKEKIIEEEKVSIIMEEDSPKQQKTQSPAKSVEEVVETKKATPVKNSEEQ